MLMKRWVPVICVVLLMPFLTLGERSPAGGDLSRLKQDFSTIISGLLSCFDQTRDRRLLEMAIRFGEIKTHPLFELSWGRDQRNAAGERRLLQSVARFRGRFSDGACPPYESELDLCGLVQTYIKANDRLPSASLLADLELPGSCRLARIQQRLSPTQLLLKFILLDDHVVLFFIGADRAGYEFLTVGRAQAVEMIGRLCEPLEDFAAGKVDYLRIHFDMELAYRLFNIFLKRVAELNPHADEFLIIPDGELYKLPFEALVTGFNDNFQPADVLFSEYQAADYVIQKYKVSYFFSFADFLRTFTGPGRYTYTLAAFGDPLVPGTRRGGAASPRRDASTIADIPSTRLEVLSLEKLFAGVPRRIFLGADFNRRNFSRFAPQAKLIHLATHFFYDEEDPSRSAFLLSSPGAAPDLCAARQVHDLRLRAELVILSACESSEKNLLGFKLVSGMTAAIRQAGVRDLIASLWPVDEFSSQVVPLFYREYLRGGNSAAALRSAKLALLGRTIAISDDVRLSLAHPFLWANYVLYHFYR
jgi:CHAT domain-containing protein